MRPHSTGYTMVFAAIICVVCGILVSSAAVSLLDRQKANAAFDKQKKVLEAAGLIQAKEAVTEAQVTELFLNVESVAVDLETRQEVPDFDLAEYDQLRAAKDPARSIEAPPNNSAINRLPKVAQIYKVRNDAGELEMVVLPIEGLGLWGTLYGFLAVEPTTGQVKGITYYTHKETPGLGGEVDNPLWKAKWPGRKVYDETGQVAIKVIKGSAGPADADPYRVDGLSGATLTCNGVTNMLDFWMGEHGFGPYLKSLTPAAQKAAF